MLIYNDGECYICSPIYDDWLQVGPETVGQFTGLTDKNNTKIFEGDILAVETSNISVECDGYFVVKYDTETARFICEGDGLTVDFDNVYGYEVEVIGNIYDSPELLKGGAEE